MKYFSLSTSGWVRGGQLEHSVQGKVRCKVDDNAKFFKDRV